MPLMGEVTEEISLAKPSRGERPTSLEALLPRKLGDAATEPGNNLNALRLGFAVLVILSHSYPLSRGPREVEPLGAWSHGSLSLGQLAVAFFFIVSGFLIAGSWERSRSLGDYLKKRSARILPGYAVAALFTLLLFVPFSTPITSYIKAVGISLITIGTPYFAGTLTRNPFPNYVNGSLWTIRYECFCYLGLALLGIVGLTRRAMVFALLSATWICFYVANERYHLLSDRKFFAIGNARTWLLVAMYFLSGMTFYTARSIVTLSPLWFACSFVAGLFACRYGGNGVAHAAVAVFGGYIALYAGFFRLPPLCRLGYRNDYSYGMYLYAFAVQQAIVAVFPAVQSPLVLFVVATSLTAPIAWASWHFVERPFLSAGRRRNLERPVG